MENKDFEKDLNENQKDDTINENVYELSETQDKNLDEIERESEGKNDNEIIKEEVLDENQKIVNQLKNKISILSKTCIGIIIISIIVLIMLNYIKNNKLKDVEKSFSNSEKHLKIELDEANKRANNIKSEYDSYKTKMQPYENIQQADKEKREAEIKAEKEKIESEKKAKKEAEEKARKEEEQKGYETGITYEELARNPDANKGKKVTFKGEVIQVIRGDGEDQYRVKVDDDYKKVIYVTYKAKSGDNKILENDKVLIRGVSLGEISYTSTMGGKISIPGISADSIEIK